jgi:hypothetical protein
VDAHPDSPAARQILSLAAKLVEPTERVKGTLQFFIGNLLSVSNA